MSYKKPNALRIAAVLDIAANALGVSDEDDEIVMAAAELRRLHALCDEMGEALEAASQAMEYMGDILNCIDATCEEDVERVAPSFDMVRAALAKWKESK